MGKHAAPSDADAVDLVISTPRLSATEIAAVTAVVTAAVHEQASDEAQQTEPVRSAWEVSLRQMRTPLTPGPGAWQRSAQ